MTEENIKKFETFRSQEIKDLQLSISSARILIANSQDPDHNPNTVLQTLNQLQSKILAYIAQLTLNFQKLTNYHSEEKMILMFVLKETNGVQFIQNQKLCLYLWQIFNYYVIHGKLFINLYLMIEKILDCTISLAPSHNILTFKHALIFIHNFLATSSTPYIQRQKLILYLIRKAFFYHFNPQNFNLVIKFQTVKNQEILLNEIEWIGYIIQRFFRQQYYWKQHKSGLQALLGEEPREIAFSILHGTGNYLQEMVDRRVTTQLVRGCECDLKDIRQIYKSQWARVIDLRFTLFDLQALCQFFERQVKNYRNHLKEYMQIRVLGSERGKLIEKVKGSAQLIGEICHILNCLLFLGGYNPKVQIPVITYILEGQGPLLLYLQLSYLVYRSHDTSSKVELVVKVQCECKKKLMQILGLEGEGFEVEEVLWRGQLVGIVRLLSNLVHINQRAVKLFEEHKEHFNMVLSLSHDSVSQPTMKEWAVLFIKHAVEWSSLLRDQVSALKINIKVQNP